MILRGARCALAPQIAEPASLEVVDGRIARLFQDHPRIPSLGFPDQEIDLSGHLIMPGLINAHDHLRFALFPKLANPPYANYIEWADDIHRDFVDVIARHRSVPRGLSLWWGGIRNLLCGVTTVSHHDPLYAELRRNDFPVRVLQEYGWGHSLAFGGDLRLAHSNTPHGHPFVIHASEGTDTIAHEELEQIDDLKILDDQTVLVHGLAIDEHGVSLISQRRASLVLCPSSNFFLFERVPNVRLLSSIENIALGSDSPLTACGDLLDEVRFAIASCGLPAHHAYRMITQTPASIFRLSEADGRIRESGRADLIALRDTGQLPSDRMPNLSMSDIELVMVGGRIQLASGDVFGCLPSGVQKSMEPLSVDGIIRWLNAPVRELLEKAEACLGKDQVRLGGKLLRIPNYPEVKYAS